MTLTLNTLSVQDITVGEQTMLAEGRLSVNTGALASVLEKCDRRISGVRVSVARPGDSTRVVCCKDVVQPSVKLHGSEIGAGVRLVLKDVGVVTCGPIVGFQEGIIDMSGPGASYTPFSTLFLIVLEIGVVEDLAAQEHEALVRAVGLHAGEFLARECANSAVDEYQTLLWDEVTADPALPRIAYVYMVLSQGLLHDTYVLGKNANEGLPSLVDPRVVADAGLVSGNCVSACDKNTTYHHRNNPVIAELLRGHGLKWNLVGVVITNEPTRLSEKERSAQAAVALVHEVEADGALITKEGFGNPDADLMMIVRSLERSGVKCVGVTDEFAGSDGASQSLADTTKEADAIVSTGNANERIVLPSMVTTLGPLPDARRLAGGYAASVNADGTIEVELQAIMGATNQLGFGYLSCQEA